MLRKVISRRRGQSIVIAYDTKSTIELARITVGKATETHTNIRYVDVRLDSGKQIDARYGKPVRLSDAVCIMASPGALPGEVHINIEHTRIYRVMPVEYFDAMVSASYIDTESPEPMTNISRLPTTRRRALWSAIEKNDPALAKHLSDNVHSKFRKEMGAEVSLPTEQCKQIMSAGGVHE